MKINGAISIFINREGTTIELYDRDASVMFVSISLTPDQLSSALSRLGHTDCERMEVGSFEKVGKKMEWKSFEFVLPPSITRWKKDVTDELHNHCQKLLDEENEGWVCTDMFASQNTFFTKDGVDYVRATVRRWV